MPVLVEAISVIVRRKRIDAVYPGGWPAFVHDCPNSTLCADDDLARVGFMAPDDVKRFCLGLERAGLTFVKDQQAIDLAVVDQFTGPTTGCDWLDFGHTDSDDIRVVSCRLVGSPDALIALPAGWRYESSLSKSSVFVPRGAAGSDLALIRREGATEVYLHRATGKEVYLGRPFNSHSEGTSADASGTKS